MVTTIGVILAALGALGAGALLLFFSRVKTIESWQTDVVVPGGFFGLSPSEIESALLLIALPGGLFLVALCFIGTGRVMRGAVGVRDTTGSVSGSVVSHNTVMEPRLHLLWLGVALAFWMLLILVPAVSALLGGWPITVDDMPQGYVWTLLGLYGGLAAAIAGVLLASFLKKRRYAAMHAADDERLLQPPSGFWRWMTFRWRFDLWLAAAGGALAGLSPVILPFGEVTVFVALLAAGILLLALGVWCAAQYWRAGVPLGFAESYA